MEGGGQPKAYTPPLSMGAKPPETSNAKIDLKLILWCFQFSSAIFPFLSLFCGIPPPDNAVPQGEKHSEGPEIAIGGAPSPIPRPWF